MHLEFEVRKAASLEQHFVHGRWDIIKIYIRGELREIIVRSRECCPT
jgi:hypothetical protein